jgi:hypothetical protein
MRKRIQEYERQGVQASLELQQAARRVAWENERLRGLIASKGITGQEIEQYLKHCQQGVIPPTLVQMERGPPIDGMAGSPSTTLRSSPIQSSSKPNAQQEVRPIGAEVILRDRSPIVEANSSTGFVPCSVPSVPYLDASNSDDMDAQIVPDETSCEVAADIIASMRWQGDKEEVRMELGCDGQRQCTVRNTTVFQIMDMT